MRTLNIADSKTGETKSIEVLESSDGGKYIKAVELESLGIQLYDPSFMNTAVTKSAITFIDGDKGILQYRGYPIEVLAEKSNFLEVAYLLIYGELPTKRQFDSWQREIMRHTFLHTNMNQLLTSFNYDAHPMGMFISGVSALSTFHPDANPSLRGSDLYLKDKNARNKQIVRMLGKSTTVAAFAYRNRIGRPHNPPQNNMSYTENLLYMMDRLSENSFKPHPKLVKALDVLFILHADHELNCSTAAMRHVGSSLVDPYSAVSAASAALYGPLHGGANEAVLKMLEEIGSVDNVASFIELVKQKKRKLMGFGHRIYKNYDPRAKIISEIAHDVFQVCGYEPLIEVAKKLEQTALTDNYFVERKLYPNVDFYSGLIYKAMGFPTDFFPVLFAIPRVAGWLAHWNESLDQDTKIWRPRQIYTGSRDKIFEEIDRRRDSGNDLMDELSHHPYSKRNMLASKL